MKFTHIIFAGDNTSKLDETIRTSRKLYNMDNMIIIIPEHIDSKFTEKIKGIKQNWKDVEIGQASIEFFEMCALDICDIISDLLVGKNVNNRDIILNIAYANSTFAVAGLFCASILKKKIISEMNGEPTEISRVPFEELIPVRYVILATIPETRVCNQSTLGDMLTKAFESGKYQQLGLESLSPTNMSYHLKKLDEDGFIVKISQGRENEIIITNLGRLMKISFEILHGKPS